MPDERRVSFPERKENVAHPDRRLAELADRQYGVVARRQLVVIGIRDKMVLDRVRSGRLVRLHRGVYAVGHRHLRREAHWLAAVLAAGPGALLSHRDAAALHGLLPPGDHRRVEVTTARRAQSTDRIHIHRTSTLDAEDATSRSGIPVTAVARTLVDLAGTVSRARLRKALDEAERLGSLDGAALEQALARTASRHGPGHRTTREALAELQAAGTTLTRSELEDRFLSLVVAHDLPRPQMNATIAGMEVDAVWARHRLAVELDGWAYHRTRRAFQEDRDRANDLTQAGYVVLRFTHADITGRPHRVAARLAQRLR
jgi:very-short-patch-repair endonuclease/predicted transcriptional regulator of viral defense system